MFSFSRLYYCLSIWSTLVVKPKIFTHHRVIHAAIGQKVTMDCLTESFPNSGSYSIPFLKVSQLIKFTFACLFSVNYWMRANPDFTSNDYVLGGSYNTSMDSYGAYVVKMKLLVKINTVNDYGVYKCIAKNALGSSEEVIKLLRKFFLFFCCFSAKQNY